MFRNLLLTRYSLSQTRTRQTVARESTSNGLEVGQMTLNEYHEASDNKLEELSEKVESRLEDRFDRGADVSLNNGVLTIVVDPENIYVINKQTPNRQIWLSSPLSGPMRFDFVEGKWFCKHNKTDLDSLISKELSKLLQESD